jgi:hypothetical protein
VIHQHSSKPPEADQATAPGRRIGTLLAVVLLLLVSTAPLVVVADLPGEASGTLAVVFPPGSGRAAVLAAVVQADGLVVRGGGWGSVLVAHSDEAGFARRLRQAGAWLVVDPRSAAGCLIAGNVNTIN